MASTSDIRNGLCIRHNNDIFKVIDFQHVKPGKGPAFVRTKLRSLTSGKVLDKTIPAGHKIVDVRVETHKYQYLYNDDQGYHFMNNDDYTQIFLGTELIDSPGLMKEGMNVDIAFNAEDEAPLTCNIPAHLILEITHTEPGVKGNTATNATKPATVETGATINVPLFINEGDKVKIDTEKGTYMERVKL
ncbi:MAG: elongation factor P [Ichthyobacteriaceae bacterium]|nr:elongation factor P [Ichthyobacteriaceae bacterium]